MRPIPSGLRRQIASDPFMQKCIYESCPGIPEWEHAIILGKQLNEAWCILPVCLYHHRGKGLDKQYNRYRALQRATEEDLNRHPKFKEAWKQELIYLSSIYENMGES